MLFTSFNFFIFYLIVLTVTYFCLRSPRKKKLFLLFASYFFYMSWDWRFGFLLFFLSTMNFYVGAIIGRAGSIFERKFWLTVSVLVSLAILGYFKYANFFVSSANSIINNIGFSLDIPLFEIILPAGISFYTFHSLSYTIDIYRGKEKPINSLADFLLFISFFPLLVAGPIVRAIQLLPQLAKEDGSRVRASEMETGLFLIVVGFIKKIAFADVMATHLVDPAFSDPGMHSAVFLWIGLYAYSFQIYMDFSAYTDIARGVAKTIGYELPINFARPYLATSVSNFWQRWHISMSSFFRDYLYHSLGGSKTGNVYFNLMITFLAIGLWHGAAWNFVLYGFMHGSFVCIERFVRGRRRSKGIPESALSGRALALKVAYIFTVISLSRVLFRSDTIDIALMYYHRLFGSSGGANNVSVIGMVILVVASILHFSPKLNKDLVFDYWKKAPAAVQAPIAVAVTYALLALSQGNAPFVYFQF